MVRGELLHQFDTLPVKLRHEIQMKSWSLKAILWISLMSAVTLNIWFIPVCTSLVRSTLFRVGLSKILTTCPILGLLAAECRNISTSAKLPASKGSTTSSNLCSSTAQASSGLDHSTRLSSSRDKTSPQVAGQ